eukprot:4773752-Prymnesium_polylepis.1
MAKWRWVEEGEVGGNATLGGKGTRAERGGARGGAAGWRAEARWLVGRVGAVRREAAGHGPPLGGMCGSVR